MTVVKFTNPPLTEVVIGVKFETPEFSAVHLGVYRQFIRDEFSASTTDHSPVTSGVELDISCSCVV